MKFDKIWGYQNEGVLFKQGRQDLNFLTFQARHKIFRVGKHKKKFLTKVGDKKMRGSSSNSAAKIQTFKLFKLD